VSSFAVFETINQAYLICSYYFWKEGLVLGLTEFLCLKIIWILEVDVQILREKSICRFKGFVGNLKHPFSYVHILSL
jgi:hypothetical protein